MARSAKLSDAARIQCVIIPAAVSAVASVMLLGLFLMDGHGVASMHMALGCGVGIGLVLASVGGLMAAVASSVWWSRSNGAGWLRDRRGLMFSAIALSPVPLIVASHSDIEAGTTFRILVGATLVCLALVMVRFAVVLTKRRGRPSQA